MNDTPSSKPSKKRTKKPTSKHFRLPSYRLHKPSGNAVVTLAGKDHYLGKHDTDESKDAYKRLLAEYTARDCSPVFGLDAKQLTMAQIVMAYLSHVEAYYVSSKEPAEFLRATNPINELYADLPACEFGPAAYKACRSWWVTNKPERPGCKARSRQYVNKMAKRVVAIIKWAVGEGLIPPTSYQAIKCVPPLKFGRTTAPEAPPIRPVAESVVAATLPYLSPVVSDMVRLQQATGCRPGEVCKIKPSMVDRSQDVWEVKLERHKTAYRGKQRTIYCGPVAQSILAKYLLHDVDTFCFSPAESARQHRERRHAARKTPLSCGNKPGSNVVHRLRDKVPGEYFTAMTYADRACSKGANGTFCLISPFPRYCSEECRRAARRWQRSEENHRYRDSENGKEYRRAEAIRYRLRCQERQQRELSQPAALTEVRQLAVIEDCQRGVTDAGKMAVIEYQPSTLIEYHPTTIIEDWER